MARLYIEYLGDSIELPRGETIVGREVGCALRFNDPAVSRRHLRFIVRVALARTDERTAGPSKDEAFVEDLTSSNGTLLNGRAISAPIRIHDGDAITVGGRTLTVRVIEDEDAALESTLLLRDGNEAMRRVVDAAPVEFAASHATTKQFKIVAPPPEANQRCPNCAAPVSDLDDQCSSCGHRWGGFRPMTPTHVSAKLAGAATASPGTLNPLSRRRHDRYSVELRLIYISSELEIEATTRDLSVSGVFVRTQILDPVGTRCDLTILIDGGPPLHVRGVVRRVVKNDDHGEPIGLGVEFTQLGANDRSWIEAVLARTS